MLTVAPGGNNLATICYNDFLGLDSHYKYVLLLLLLLLCCLENAWICDVRIPVVCRAVMGSEAQLVLLCFMFYIEGDWIHPISTTFTPKLYIAS